MSKIGMNLLPPAAKDKRINISHISYDIMYTQTRSLVHRPSSVLFLIGCPYNLNQKLDIRSSV